MQSTTVTDPAGTAEEVGAGALCTPELYRQQVGNTLAGLGETTAWCPVCRPLTADRSHGMGVLLPGDRIARTENPAGEGAAMAYRQDRRVAIAFVTTLTAAAYDEARTATDPSFPLLREPAGAVAPDSPLGRR